MRDHELRDIERAAALGQPGAVAALRAAEVRIGRDLERFDDALLELVRLEAPSAANGWSEGSVTPRRETARAIMPVPVSGWALRRSDGPLLLIFLVADGESVTIANARNASALASRLSLELPSVLGGSFRVLEEGPEDAEALAWARETASGRVREIREVVKRWCRRWLKAP